MKRIESRIEFDYATKKMILDKCNAHCCHCGKGLTTKTMTIDHFIPISKGGSNDIENLFALCEDCNFSKSDFNISANYYKYLDKSEIFKLERLRKNFNEDLSWLSINSLTKEDVETMYYATPAFMLGSHKPKQPRDLSKDNFYAIKQTAILKRVDYSELDEVYEFVNKYHDKYGLGKVYLKDTLSQIFDRGAIYKLYHGNDIIAVLPFEMTTVSYKNENKQYYVLSLDGIMCLYQKWYYKELIYDAIRFICSSVSFSNDRRCIHLGMYVASEDDFAKEIAEVLRPTSYGKQNEDGFNQYFFVHIFTDDDNKEALARERNKNIDGSKLIEEFSLGVQRVMKLKPLNEQGESSSTPKQKQDIKPKRKKVNEIDEYDLEFYM